VSKAVFGDAKSPLKGLTQRNKVLGAGHKFLVNKYYLDALYENVIVRGIAYPISKAAYWVNQNVLDGIVNGRQGRQADRRVGLQVHRPGLVDGAPSMEVVQPHAAPVARCNRCNQARSTSTERCCSVPQQSVRSYSSS
jgi:NADH:ubiquinone oxidoreductase subunit 5 (subunit L)/multisubunit Na+/H+ antiporter MnhA subunit